MIYLELFLAFLQIGLFSVGGGYAAMPLIQAQVVESHSWLSMSEFTDLVTIAEMTPGPIAVNAATFVGIRVAGIGGAVIATLGDILPSCVICTLLALLYFRYKELPMLQSILGALRPAIVALIAGAGLTILIQVLFSGQIGKDINWIGMLIFLCAFALLRIKKFNPILVMLLSGAAGLLLGAWV